MPRASAGVTRTAGFFSGVGAEPVTAKVMIVLLFVGAGMAAFKELKRVF